MKDKHSFFSDMKQLCCCWTSSMIGSFQVSLFERNLFEVNFLCRRKNRFIKTLQKTSCTTQLSKIKHVKVIWFWIFITNKVSILKNYISIFFRLCMYVRQWFNIAEYLRQGSNVYEKRMKRKIFFHIQLCHKNINF